MQAIDRLKAKKRINKEVKTYTLTIKTIERIQFLAEYNCINYNDVIEKLVNKQKRNELN